MGILPDELETLNEEQIDAYLEIHEIVKRHEQKLWDARIKAILKALGAKVYGGYS